MPPGTYKKSLLKKSSFLIIKKPHFQELIDFGLVPSDGEAKTTKLLVLNSGQRAIPVQNVVVTPVSEAVTVSFRPQKISPDTLRPAVVAQVTFDRKFNKCRIGAAFDYVLIMD